MNVVTLGNKQDHEKKLFDVLNKLEKAGYIARKRNRFLHEQNKTARTRNKQKRNKTE